MSTQNSDAREKAKYDLFSPSFLADPHTVFHRMRAEDPIYWHPDLKVWIFTRHNDIQAMVRDARFSAERVGQFTIGASDAMKDKLDRILQFLSHWMVGRDPPRHTLLRALVGKAFTPQVVEGLRPAVQKLVDDMLEVVADAGQMDLIRDLAYPLPANVIGRMLGVPPADIDRFKAWTTDLFALIGAGIATDEAVEAGYRGVIGLEGYFRELIARRRAVPADDLLSRLIAAEEQGTFLNEEELVSTCAMLLVGGHETTAHFIGNSVHALLQNPSQMEMLQDEPELIEGAMEELFRYGGSIFMLTRRALEDIDVGGVKIHSNDYVFGFVPAANRDPSVFKDPDQLDITRRGVKSLTFGHGIHYCIGMALARLEATIALTAILTRLPGLALASPSVERLPSIVLYGLAALPVTFRPRTAARLSEPPPSWAGPASLRSPLSQRAPVSVPVPPSGWRQPPE